MVTLVNWKMGSLIGKGKDRTGKRIWRKMKVQKGPLFPYQERTLVYKHVFSTHHHSILLL